MPPPPSIAAWRAAHLVERLARIVRAGDYAAGLNPAQMEALRFLARANRFSRTPSALAAFFGATRGTVSQTLKTLEAKGYIEKAPSEDDGRVVRLSLTPSGRAAIEADGGAALAGAIEAAGDVVATLKALEAALHRSPGGSAFGVCKSCRHFSREGGARRCARFAADLAAQEAEAICAAMEAA